MFGYGSYCCVAWCGNNGRTRKKPGTKFFRVPRDDRSKAWLRYAKRDDLLRKSSSELHAKYFVCSSHFTARDFMDPGRTKLMKTAVPSVRPSTYSDAERAKDFMEAKTPPCGADPMEATASSFRPEEPSTAAHDSMEATPPPCGVDPIEASAPSCGAASSFRPKEPSTAAHDSMEVTPPPCGVDPIEASAPSCGAASSSRPKEPSTAAHDSMEATPPPCGVDPIEASAPSCGAASSFRPEEPSTAAHDSMGPTTPPCGADPMEATASSFRPEEPSTAAHDSMEVTPPACSVDPMEASAPSCGAASSFRPEEPSTAAHDSMGPTTPPCGADPMEATASSFRPEEPSTAAHDSMEVTPPACSVDPMEASAPSCGAASSFRPEEPSTAAHDSMGPTIPPCGADPMEATASSFRPEEPSTAAHDSMEATASPCGADSTEATAPSCSSPLDFRSVTPSTWSSSEPVGACTSTPPLRSSAPRPKDIIRRLQAKVSKYRKTIARLRKQEKNMPRSAAEALNIIRPHVTDEVFHLLSSHVKLKSKGKGKRFPLWLKKFSLHLNFRGPRAYRFLSRYLTLPTQRTLRRWLSDVKMTPGIIPGIMSSIFTKTQSWSKRDRVCTLIFDEIVLKKNLSYDVSQDVVHGFTDDGYEQTSTIADRALVILLSGVSRRWVQPVAYTIGHTSTPSTVIRNLLISLTEQLQDIGITVKAVICDQGASNVSLANQLGVSVAQPFFFRKT
ncbi:proteoglycan 4-like [Ixodes scapularis]|uniref:proteoglycan 4-like n=1 Tax=Ixodes scapularis TaxID=6945 RepID=UPI001C386540|nr:proteoglycan 4-like [Ixodes scapularis]XP_042143063.1 proteoglycan 4-like [Ixodes scapularis]